MYRLILGRVRRLPIQTQVDWAGQTRRVICRRLDPSTSRRILEQARSFDTTVHALLSAAFLLAFSRKQDEPMTLCPTSMLGLRKYLTSNVDKDVGMFVSLVPAYVRVSPEKPLLDVARQFRKQLQRSLRRGDPLAALPPLRMLVPFLSRMPDNKLYQKLNSLFPTTLTISNLGRLRFDDGNNEFILKEVDFTISPFGDAAIAVGASTFAGQLTINLSFIEPLIRRDYAEQLIDEALARLDNQDPSPVY